MNANEITSSPGNQVLVTSSGFSPQTITIKAGESVTWINAAGAGVYVAPDNHPDHTKYQGIWDDDGTGDIANGQEYSQTFQRAGTYTYHNHLDSTVTGTVVVE